MTHSRTIIAALLLSFFLCWVPTIYAATETAPLNITYKPLEPFPNVNESGNGDFGSILNFAFRLAFSIGGGVATITLIIGGITYMVSEVANKKEAAKKRIQSSLYGLLILSASWLILHTINPQLLSFTNIFTPANQSVTVGSDTQNSQSQNGNGQSGSTNNVNGCSSLYTVAGGSFYPNLAGAKDALNKCSTDCANKKGTMVAIESGTDNAGVYTVYQCQGAPK